MVSSELSHVNFIDNFAGRKSRKSAAVAGEARMCGIVYESSGSNHKKHNYRSIRYLFGIVLDFLYGDKCISIIFRIVLY